MNDPLPLTRLDVLRFLERVQVRDLERTRRWIADEERRENERLRREERRPPEPEWLIQYGLNRRNVDVVHRGDCWAAAKSGRCHPASKEQVVEALQNHVEPCGFCRPDTDLGF
ncbi:hypothetical protein EJC51_18055 [Streptomyces aquilus]|uniref:Uncharacterized protein n=1 Tax=Streptomyces aquilus TaxID=2548456 RepID=A0A3Q9BZ08_9ACTN|nr:DUF6233 domain-containing protein [Streptomyces aquilus]AZP17836.1 hypothetical protein EJC51_18055 [Streptomyces aquilus]